VEGLVAREVLVESFEEGESVARFLTRNGNAKLASVVAANAASAAKGAKAAAAVASSSVVAASPVAAGADELPSADDMILRSAVAATGMQCLLKMLVFDNFVHADLHPGNVIIRMERQAPLARFQVHFYFLLC